MRWAYPLFSGHMYNVLLLRSEHTFSSLCSTALRMAGSALRAFCGHMLIHCRQEIHFSASVAAGSFSGIAFTGQRDAQIPQRIHLSYAAGIIVDLPVSLYGYLPGTFTGAAVSLSAAALSLAEKSRSSFSSSASGLPVP